MKTAAIIAEYNPFHNGHQYQIEQTRLETGADFILAVMSGDFVQRGAPALVDKYTRTRMALLGGVDVVIELPSLYALSSAEFFAQGAVTLLEQLHVADILSFGSEWGEPSAFEHCARLLVESQEEISHRTGWGLKKGLSFPTARARAISELSTGAYDAIPVPQEELINLFSSPNNILGLEYCKALYASRSGIRPFTIRREGRGYHDLSLGVDNIFSQNEGAPPFASASALRRAFVDRPEVCREYMPQEVWELLAGEEPFVPVTEEDFSGLLHYKLITEQEAGFCAYLDCTPSLSDKIRKNLPLFTGFFDFCRLLKSRELTYARISRVLMHILLNIRTPEAFRETLPERKLSVPCARLLGFRESAAPLLSAIRKNSSIPLISKLADARFLLEEEGLRLLKQDIYCADIYEAARPKKKGAVMRSEWRQSPIVLAKEQ